MCALEILLPAIRKARLIISAKDATVPIHHQCIHVFINIKSREKEKVTKYI